MFSLGELTDIIGAKSRRVPQVWAEAGVIEAEAATDRAGTGTHRRFSRTEAVIACFIQTFALRQVSIGELKAISEKLRALLSTPAAKLDVETAISGDPISESVYLLLALSSTANLRDGSTVFRCEFRRKERSETSARVQAEVGRRATEALTMLPDGMVVIIHANMCLAKLRGR